MKLKLKDIILDEGLQTRTAIDQATVDKYAKDMVNGETFPPVTVFVDENMNWLADGRHRYYAAEKAGLEEIDVDLRDGHYTDALLFAVSANDKHGLKRSRKDKQRAAKLLLSDPELAQLPNRELAKIAGVTHRTIAKFRDDPDGGKFTTQNTAFIGLSSDGRYNILLRPHTEIGYFWAEAISDSQHNIIEDHIKCASITQFKRWLEYRFHMEVSEYIWDQFEYKGSDYQPEIWNKFGSVKIKCKASAFDRGHTDWDRVNKYLDKITPGALSEES